MTTDITSSSSSCAAGNDDDDDDDDNDGCHVAEGESAFSSGEANVIVPFLITFFSKYSIGLPSRSLCLHTSLW